uniref:C-type lectin domain-containing protein n=1 Tax=Hucho hucho TaxID=62062 RepID=A0A4W5RMC3_9TELE
ALSYSFITAALLVVALTICPPGWISFSGNCYWVVSNKMFLTSCWSAAREDCTSRGADLVSIHNMEEEDFLSTHTKGKSKWIGLKHNPTDGGYHWSDATPVTMSRCYAEKAQLVSILNKDEQAYINTMVRNMLVEADLFF